ncbi:zinc-binding dehydrogenase [Streptomyces sp. NPDC059909]|uniref:zinc-binding dehydrogenase n=1 Tax=Streptomyces sp. NPDC059909 TaxID=3346998 RepID=UPI00365AA297
MRSYGADRIVDHTATPLPQSVAGERFDAVVNLVPTSPEETAALVDLVADGGSSAPPPPVPRAQAAACARCGYSIRSDAARLADLVTRVDAGDLKIDVAHRRPLADLAAVHDAAAAGRLPGKTVLVP